MKQPDRFERMIGKGLPYGKVRPQDLIAARDAVNLLRKEHAWMRRMVKKVDAWACQELADNDDVIAEILKQLEQRRK